MKEVRLVQGAKTWTAYLDPRKIALIEGVSQSNKPLEQKARILINGVWLLTDETVQTMLDLTK